MSKQNNTARGSAWGRLASALALFAVAVALSGCYVSAATPGPVAAVDVGVPYARAEVVPSPIDVYPRYYYRGSYAYLVEGRWYYPTTRGWVILRQEPRELARYRTTLPPSSYYYRGAPRTRPPAPGYGYPPEHYHYYRPR